MNRGIKFIFSRYLKFILKLCKFNYVVDSIILSRLKKIKKNMENRNFFFCRWVCISVGCNRIFLKDLKLPINSYFCRPDRIILSRLKKIKKNKEISKFFFFVTGFAFQFLFPSPPHRARVCARHENSVLSAECVQVTRIQEPRRSGRILAFK